MFCRLASPRLDEHLYEHVHEHFYEHMTSLARPSLRDVAVEVCSERDVREGTHVRFFSKIYINIYICVYKYLYMCIYI